MLMMMSFASATVVDHGITTVQVLSGADSVFDTFSPLGRIVIPETTAFGYQISGGEVCVGGFCGGAGGPVADPLTVTLTNFTIECTAGGGCDPLQIVFGQNNLTGNLTGLPFNFRIAGSHNGSASLEGFYTWGVDIDGNAIFGNFEDPLSLPAGGFNTELSFGSDFGCLSEPCSYNFGITVALPGLSFGQSLSLPNSMVLAFGDLPEENQVPEPASLWLAASGLVLAWAARRRFRRLPPPRL
jgi:hypothetical protein